MRYRIMNTLTEYSGLKDGDKLMTFEDVVNRLNDYEEREKKLVECLKKISKELGIRL